MNLIKIFFVSISFLVCSSISAQQESVLSESKRIIVLQDDQASVAVLNQEGFVLRNIIDIPSYFSDNHPDEYYIEASYKELSDHQLEKELKENVLTIKTLASNQLEPSENQ